MENYNFCQTNNKNDSADGNLLLTQVTLLRLGEGESAQAVKKRCGGFELLAQFVFKFYKFFDSLFIWKLV